MKLAIDIHATLLHNGRITNKKDFESIPFTKIMNMVCQKDGIAFGGSITNG